MTITLGVAAAVLLGLGFVLQQRGAREAPPQDDLSVRLIIDLVRRPIWICGIAAMVAGQVLGALALREGDVSLIEPLLTTNLLFALVLARLLSGQELGKREWVGAGALIAGVVTFVVAAEPGAGTTSPLVSEEWVFVAVVAVIVVVLTARGRRAVDNARATMLAAAAGLLFGLQDGFTRAAMLVLQDGLLDLVTSSWPYVVVVVAVVGLILAQTAFRAAPLRASLPAITAAEPLTGIAFGIAVFGESVRLAPVWIGLEVAGLGVMVTGVVLLTRSTLLAHFPLPHRQVRQ